jgi:hypothetical protein
LLARDEIPRPVEKRARGKPAIDVGVGIGDELARQRRNRACDLLFA